MALAKALKRDVMFGYVDAREEPALRRLLKPECEHVCRVTVVKRGENISRVEVKSELSKNLKNFQAFVGPLITVVEKKSVFKQLLKANDAVAIAVGLSAEQQQLYEEAAGRLRGVVRATALSASANVSIMGSVTVPAPGFAVFRGVDKVPQTVEFPLSSSGIDLAVLLRSCSYGLLPTYTHEMNHDLELLGLPVARVWVDDSPNNTKLYEDLALLFRGQLMFVRMVPKDNMHLLVDFGLAKELPAFSISRSYLWDSAKFAHDGPHTLAALSAFCERVLKGEEPEAFKSEPIPKETLQPGAVGKVVWHTLKHVQYEMPEEVLLIFRKSWAMDWNQRQDTLSNLARCTEPAGLIVAVYDTANNLVNRSVFPTADAPGAELDVYLFRTLPDGTRTSTKYGKGTWVRKDLLRFLKAKSAKVQQHWAEVVAESEKITEEVKLREEEAVKARLAQEELLKILPKREVGPKPGDVTKHIRKEGEGDLPGQGALITAHYTGTLLDGAEFDSSRCVGGEGIGDE